MRNMRRLFIAQWHTIGPFRRSGDPLIGRAAAAPPPAAVASESVTQRNLKRERGEKEFFFSPRKLTLHVEAHDSVLDFAASLLRQQTVILARVLVCDAPKEERTSFGQESYRVLCVPHNYVSGLRLEQLLLLLEPLDFVHRRLAVAGRHRQARKRPIGALPDVEGFGLGCARRAILLLAKAEEEMDVRYCCVRAPPTTSETGNDWSPSIEILMAPADARRARMTSRADQSPPVRWLSWSPFSAVAAAAAETEAGASGHTARAAGHDNHNNNSRGACDSSSSLAASETHLRF